MDKTKMPREKGARKRPRERWLGSPFFGLWEKHRWDRLMEETARIVASGNPHEVIEVRPGGSVYYHIGSRQIRPSQLRRLARRGVVPRKDLALLVNLREQVIAREDAFLLLASKQGRPPRTEGKMPEKLPNDPDPFEALFEKWRHGVEAVSPEQEVQQWLAEKKKLGKKHYELVLNLGDDEGKKTLRELVEGERWDEALQIIHRVDHW